MRYEKSCGAVIFRKDTCWNVLLIRHIKGRHISFPKGHVEPGESERITAEREVFEETSVRIHISEKFRQTVYYKPRPNSNKEVVYFLAFTRQSEISPREGEIAEVEWIPLEDAEKCLAHENDKTVFRAAMERMQNLSIEIK